MQKVSQFYIPLKCDRIYFIAFFLYNGAKSLDFVQSFHNGQTALLYQ